MSLEQLLFIAFLVVVPLLEFVVRRAREAGTPEKRRPPVPRPIGRAPGATQRSPAPRRRDPSVQTAALPPATPTIPPEPVPAPRLGAQLPITLEGKSLEVLGDEIGARASVPPLASGASRPTRPLRRRRSAIGSPEELRRAIVIAIVLGPCKAADTMPGRSDVLRI